VHNELYNSYILQLIDFTSPAEAAVSQRGVQQLQYSELVSIKFKYSDRKNYYGNSSRNLIEADSEYMEQLDPSAPEA